MYTHDCVTVCVHLLIILAQPLDLKEDKKSFLTVNICIRIHGKFNKKQKMI
jgi:hypothetical protein